LNILFIVLCLFVLWLQFCVFPWKGQGRIDPVSLHMPCPCCSQPKVNISLWIVSLNRGAKNRNLRKDWSVVWSRLLRWGVFRCIMGENPLSHSAVHGLMTHMISISFRMFKNLSGFSASKPSYICKKCNQNKIKKQHYLAFSFHIKIILNLTKRTICYLFIIN